MPWPHQINTALYYNRLWTSKHNMFISLSKKIMSDYEKDMLFLPGFWVGIGLQGLLLQLLEPVDHGIGLGAAPQDVELFWQPLLPPDDRLRLPNEEERLEVNSSGDPRGVDITVTKTELNVNWQRHSLTLNCTKSMPSTTKKALSYIRVTTHGTTKCKDRTGALPCPALCCFPVRFE